MSKVLCPNCKNELNGKVHIRTDIQSAFGDRIPEWENTPFSSGVIRCEKCQEMFQLKLKIELVDIVLAAPTKKVPERTPTEKRILDLATDSGILQAFSRAVQTLDKVSGVDLARDNPSYFLYFFETIRWLSVPRRFLEYFKTRFGGVVKVYKSQGVCVIVSDGNIKAFVPEIAIYPTPIQTRPIMKRGETHEVRIQIKRDAQTEVEKLESMLEVIPSGTQLYLPSIRKVPAEG